MDNQNQTDHLALIESISQYLFHYQFEQQAVFDCARLGFMDAIGHGLMALRLPECCKHLGPYIHGTLVPGGARVFGTCYELDPAKSAFDMTCMMSWLDRDLVVLGADIVYPTELLGAVLSVADYVSKQRVTAGYAPLTMREVLAAQIKAFEIQLALTTNNAVGHAHSLASKIASTAVTTQLLGGDPERVKAAIALAMLDALQLKFNRSAYPTQSALSSALNSKRSVTLSLMAIAGESGFADPQCPSANELDDFIPGGLSLKLSHKLEAVAVQNILFRHGQSGDIQYLTAIELARMLHPQVGGRLAEIDRVEVKISESQSMENKNARHHKMIAMALMFGDSDFEDSQFITLSSVELANLVAKISITQSSEMNNSGSEEDAGNFASSLRVYFNDGDSTEEHRLSLPVGHPLRRHEGEAMIKSKFESHIYSRYSKLHAQEIIQTFDDKALFEELPVNELMDLLVI